MKYVTKFLCAIAITAFISSCASSGSGCYDFGDNTEVKTEASINEIEIVSVSKKDNNRKEILTICED